MRRFLGVAAVTLAPVYGFATELFDDDTILDIRLSGALASIARDKREEPRDEYPFVLTVGGVDVPVWVRVRGHSRTRVCEFPPLRLRFDADAASGTAFTGESRLKLVTHCKSAQPHYQNNLLEEFAAYRIFNLISPLSYRVRLLRIGYHDTDGELDDLDEAHYAFVIESDEGLARRIGGTVVKQPGVLYSQLDTMQTARLNVFQYLIANADWSLVTAADETDCCHNVDLIERAGKLLAIPYDFDLSGLVNANYAEPPEELHTRRVTTRKYRGYCRSSIEDVAAALDEIAAQRGAILDAVESVPAVGGERPELRRQYVDRFFEEATGERAKLLRRFEKDCIGRR